MVGGFTRNATTPTAIAPACLPCPGSRNASIPAVRLPAGAVASDAARSVVRDHLVARGRLRHRRCLAGKISRSEAHTSELQSLMRISYAVFCLKKKKHYTTIIN